MVVHDLDDHLPAEVKLASQVDPAHAAFSQEPRGLIPAQEDSADHGTSISTEIQGLIALQV